MHPFISYRWNMPETIPTFYLSLIVKFQALSWKSISGRGILAFNLTLVCSQWCLPSTCYDICLELQHKTLLWPRSIAKQGDNALGSVRLSICLRAFQHSQVHKICLFVCDQLAFADKVHRLFQFICIFFVNIEPNHNLLLEGKCVTLRNICHLLCFLMSINYVLIVVFYANMGQIWQQTSIYQIVQYNSVGIYYFAL